MANFSSKFKGVLTSGTETKPLETINVPKDNVLALKMIVTGIKTDGSKAISAYILSSFINNGGVLTEVFDSDYEIKSQFEDATIDLTKTGDLIVVNVTGEADTDIRWFCEGEYLLSYFKN